MAINIMIISVIHETNDRISVAAEIVRRQNWSQFHFLREGIQIIPYPLPVTKGLSTLWRILLGIEALWLLVQQENIPVRRASRWRRRADIVRNERGRCCQDGLARCGGIVGWFKSRMNPVQDGS